MYQNQMNELLQAAQAGDENKLRSLLATNPELANMENAEGLTPLGYAAHYGHPNAVKTLLEHGVEVNAISHSKVSYIPSNTALHAGIAGGCSIEVIKLLLECGAKTDILDSNGYTPIEVAASHKSSKEIIELLEEYNSRGA